MSGDGAEIPCRRQTPAQRASALPQAGVPIMTCDLPAAGTPPAAIVTIGRHQDTLQIKRLPARHRLLSHAGDAIGAPSDTGKLLTV